MSKLDTLTYRVYFSPAEGFPPQVWSVDEGNQSTEIKVTGIRFEAGVSARTRQARTDDPNSPKAWMEVTGRLSVEYGKAIFRK